MTAGTWVAWHTDEGERCGSQPIAVGSPLRVVGADGIDVVVRPRPLNAQERQAIACYVEHLNAS
jgi:hypothetical protein